MAKACGPYWRARKEFLDTIHEDMQDLDSANTIPDADKNPSFKKLFEFIITVDTPQYNDVCDYVDDLNKLNKDILPEGPRRPTF